MSNSLMVLKYGGNAMTDDSIKKELLNQVCALHQQGHYIVLVHGGGPFIQQALEEAKIESEFIEGQRKTSNRALEYVEMALKGRVNGQIVKLLNAMGCKAVGLSGKDGRIVIAEKRYHIRKDQNGTHQIDLGQVGNVTHVDTHLIKLLLRERYLPVITCIASNEKGEDFNINGDIFAGHIAGALGADEFIVLTDVDGLMKDINDPDSVIRNLKKSEVSTLLNDGTIRGGMMPKIEACITSIESGARSARIINGTKPGQLSDLVHHKESIGTQITE